MTTSSATDTPTTLPFLSMNLLLSIFASTLPLSSAGVRSFSMPSLAHCTTMGSER